MTAATMELMIGETRPRRALFLLVTAAAILCLLLPYVQEYAGSFGKKTAAGVAPTPVTASVSRVANDASQGIRTASAAGL